MEERAERKKAGIRIDYRRRGLPRSRADLVDISKTGCLIDTSASVRIGESISIYLGNLQPLRSNVVRVAGFQVACQFERPIDDAVYEHWASKL
ncbi:PilZ domain-containing protein [Parasphingopyxis sp.]|uniref:PilZ domain-containing protein n=1 Tax=Parasphingopyxis sp. TaxID=1920299 RepID=UPI003458F5E2